MTWSISHFYLCCMTVSRFWLTPRPSLKSLWATQLIGFMATRSVLRSFNRFPSQFVSLNHLTLFDMKILSFSAPSLRWHINVKQCELPSGDFLTMWIKRSNCWTHSEYEMKTFLYRSLLYFVLISFVFCVDLFHILCWSLSCDFFLYSSRRCWWASGQTRGSRRHFRGAFFIPYFIFGGFYWQNKPSPIIIFVFVMDLYLHWFFPGEMNTSWLTQCSIS